ncbi:MAG: PepSY domain-containing protein [Anaerovoracaceae bacterium]
MKESNKIIEKRLKKTVETMVPDILPQLLEHTRTEGEDREMANSIIATMESHTTGHSIAKKVNMRIIKTLGIVAASILLFIGSYAGFTHYSPQTIVGFDINPSIEMSLNRSEKILKVIPLNEDGRIVIGNMNFRNVDLDIGINALIGSMAKKGYLNDMGNSILITIESQDAKKGKILQEHISNEVQGLLNSYDFKASILSQVTKSDIHVQELAKEYDISTGKAFLIENLIKKHPSLQYSDAASMPINDISLLIEASNSKPEGVKSSGQPSDKKYIGSEKAIAIALQNAGVAGKDSQKIEVELDFEDGRMIYEVEFYMENKKYDYEIDAINGKILELKIKDKSISGSSKVGKEVQENQQPIKSHSSPTKYIDERRALEIALKHVGATESQVHEIEIELENEDGIMVYEVEFIYNGLEYECEIDAETGRIRE